MSETTDTPIPFEPTNERERVDRRIIHVQVIVDGSALTSPQMQQSETPQSEAPQGRPPVFMVSDDPDSEGDGTSELVLRAARRTKIIWSSRCLQPSWEVVLKRFHAVQDPHHVFRWSEPIAMNGFYQAKVRHLGVVSLSATIELYNLTGDPQGSFKWSSSIKVV
jgi:hypothetical protein